MFSEYEQKIAKQMSPNVPDNLNFRLSSLETKLASLESNSPGFLGRKAFNLNEDVLSKKADLAELRRVESEIYTQVQNTINQMCQEFGRKKDIEYNLELLYNKIVENEVPKPQKIKIRAVSAHDTEMS